MEKARDTEEKEVEVYTKVEEEVIIQPQIKSEHLLNTLKDYE